MTVPPPVDGPGANGGDGAASLDANNLVVDAGVAIKWYVPEIHEGEAKRLLDPIFTLHVPELFFPEFGSIIWKKSRLLKAPELTEEEGRGILGLLLAVDLEVHPMAPLLESAYSIAVGPESPTVYDKRRARTQ
jgi:predicted nucleic acid-binding protein